jgi:hypothetical protein
MNNFLNYRVIKLLFSYIKYKILAFFLCGTKLVIKIKNCNFNKIYFLSYCICNLFTNATLFYTYLIQ